MKFLSRFAFVLVLTMAAPALAQQGGAAANLETRLSTLEDEMRALNGQVEQLGFSIRRLDQNVQRMQSDYDARLTKLETSVGALNDAAAARAAVPVAPPGTVDGSIGAIKSRDGRVTGAVVAPQAPLVADEPAMSPQEEYERAFGLLRQANYDEAEKAFKEFIDNNPKDKMIDNAKYWHAETLYVRGRFADAATGFADAYQQNPQGNKAPDSLLKLSMSLSAMGKVPDACTALAELRSKYPSATPTVKTRADEQRAKLKCS